MQNQPAITFQELYHRLLRTSAEGGKTEGAEAFKGYDYSQLDCLLNPGTCPVVMHLGTCDGCDDAQRQKCAASCAFDAMKLTEDGIEIDPEACTGCEACLAACEKGKLVASKDGIAVLRALKERKGPVYAMVAPAFLGQFSPDVTPGKLRTAFKQMGFEGMLEVAVFADILTLKEALEFDRNILTEEDYQLTSCCCPMWIAMIRKVYNELMPHVPAAVSPMVAAGRTVKSIHPGALTVFVGPCLAKKAEAKEPDLVGAVDYVLTFEEMKELFTVLGIHAEALPESEKEFSSRAGRIYARTGGVSEAVKETVERMNPDRKIAVKTRQADGVPGCKQLLNELREGKADANFFEGMGCVGGCVGGPKAIINRETGRAQVNVYGDAASYRTPIDNPYVIELLHRLGFDTIDSLLEYSDIFTRRL